MDTPDLKHLSLDTLYRCKAKILREHAYWRGCNDGSLARALHSTLYYDVVAELQLREEAVNNGTSITSVTHCN